MPPENLRFSKGTEVLIPRVGEDPMDYNHCTWLSMPDVAIGEMISVFNTDNNPLFTATMFNATLQNEFAMRVEGGSVTNLYFEKLKNIEVSFPSIQEQEKIAAYFENLDHLITLHQRKCEETKSLKKYMLQKMFPENGKCVPEIRFSGFSDAWEQRKLEEYLGVSKEKNRDESFGKDDVLSVSGEYGIVNQIEFQGRSFAGASVANYGVVEGGDVVYTKSPLKSNPYGIIKTNKGKTGIVSTLYAVYKPKNNVGAEFVQIYFELDSRMNSYMHPLVNKGAKNDMKVSDENALKGSVIFPKIDEQKAISKYFAQLDHLITLHQRKCYRFIDIALDAWEQRKLGEIYGSIGNAFVGTATPYYVEQGHFYLESNNVKDGQINHNSEIFINDEFYEKQKDKWLHTGDVVMVQSGHVGHAAVIPKELNNTVAHALIMFRNPKEEIEPYFLNYEYQTDKVKKKIENITTGNTIKHILASDMQEFVVDVPKYEEQKVIASYFSHLDHLITLHQHKLFCAKNVMKYITTDINTPKKEAIMAELESVIEQKLIEQLIYGDSQWTYREDLKTEADLWKNFRYILEQNNKERLNGEPLSDAEFEQVKNQLQFSSFYKAGEWLVGENGKVMVHVQRDTERLHLVVMNHEHIAGGSSVYEVINQYNALKMDEDSSVNARDRRFDVTLMINGLPMIHIELKNKQHSYMDGFRQIKKYIGEGKFTGIFSAVQMFVISNGVDTKYFSAASDTELNPKFISGWLDKENNAVSDYLDFAKSVLRIPEAHEMIARYTVLDEEAKRLILLRPYQIHAIEAIRDASKTGKSGFVWHTTGSGKTLTSYKATRNLLMDIPAIDKAIFLIDRKDLDTQTTMAFQAYANNDLVDVDLSLIHI